MIRQKHVRQAAGFIFSLYIYKQTFKNLLVRNRWTDFMVTLYQDSLSRDDWSKNMTAREGVRLIFSIYLYRKR